MRVTYIANAGCIYETKKGIKLLADPWLTPGAFEGSWIHDPPLKMTFKDIQDIDILYISHLHPDHFDETILKQFRKNVLIVILKQEPSYLLRKLKSLGFTEIIQIEETGRQIDIPGFTVAMFKPFTTHPFHRGEIPNMLDSAIVIEADGIKILNGNDNTLTLEAAEKLKSRLGSFDLIQLVDSCAGPYPACFKNLTHEEKIQERDRILNRHLTHTIDCAKILNPKFIQPFAGHYQLQGPLASLNQYLAVLKPEEVAERYEKAGLTPLLLKEGQSYVFV